MGASDSKLVFKQGIFKLSEQKQIPATDPYWAGFWELPESADDIFSLFSPTDIRRIRDDSLQNLETLILAVTARLYELRQNPEFPSWDGAPERHALNCVRVLTRLLPYIYEAEHLEDWEDKFFWSTRRRKIKVEKTNHGDVVAEPEEVEGEDGATTREPREEEMEDLKPLAEELIDTLIDLLFFTDFTLVRTGPEKPKVTYSIWQSGVGCNTAVGTSQDIESRRMEILRLLLTLSSKSMYTSANVLPVQGVKAITYITTLEEKQIVLTLLCSLLNTAIKYNPATWRVPYDHMVFKDTKQVFVTYCLQLLLVLVLYPVPDSATGVPPKNSFRHFLGKLHRPQDFQFLVDGMTRILNQPLQATTSLLPGSQKSLTWAPEMIMLFWEVLQCNKRFRSFIVDTDRAHDFVVLILFHAVSNRNDPTKQGIVRMCVFVLQTLSVEDTFGSRLNKTFQGQETLPPVIRLPNFHGTYADFLIIHIYTLITSSKGKLDAIYPALLAIINNVAPHVLELSGTASSKLLQLFNTMSSPTFILANETNHALLKSLLEAMNAIIDHQYESNPTFVYGVLRSQKRFHALRDFVEEGGQSEIDRMAAVRKQAEEDSRIRSPTGRQPSMESMRSPARRPPSLSDVPEEGGTFAIGEEDDSDSEGTETRSTTRSTPAPSIHSREHSRAPSIAESVEDAVPLQLRGMSEKARGKLPAGQDTFTRHSSSTSISTLAITTTLSMTGTFEPDFDWMLTWLPDLPMQTILTLIDQLNAKLPPQVINSASACIQTIRSTEVTDLERDPVRVHLFEWSPLSLGWYESLLWSFIFSFEVQTSGGGPGLWKGTQIRLFKVHEIAPAGPSLTQPLGAVDAVGSMLTKKIGSLNFGALQQRATGNGASPQRMRDV